MGGSTSQPINSVVELARQITIEQDLREHEPRRLRELQALSLAQTQLNQSDRFNEFISRQQAILNKFEPVQEQEEQNWKPAELKDILEFVEKAKDPKEKVKEVLSKKNITTITTATINFSPSFLSAMVISPSAWITGA